MNVEHLKLFTNLAETLNFSQTAKNLHLSQPAVTQSINSLETELGFRLFNRTKRHVALTAGGQSFVNAVAPMLVKLEGAIETARAESERTVSTLSIGYTGTYYELMTFPKLINAFNKAHPNARIYLENFNHNRLKEHLVNQECDVTFPMQDSVHDTPAIDFIPLITGRFACIVPRTNLLAQCTTLTLADLADQTLIIFNANTCPPRQFDIQQLLKHECPNANFLYSDSVMLSHTMVQGDLGIAIMVDLASVHNSPDFATVPLDYPGWQPYTYGMAVMADNHDPLLREFTNCAQCIIH